MRTSLEHLYKRNRSVSDEIPNRTDDSLIATGFLRAGPRVRNHEHANPARRYDYTDDVLGAVGKGMLGMTVQCARCHRSQV